MIDATTEKIFNIFYLKSNQDLTNDEIKQKIRTILNEYGVERREGGYKAAIYNIKDAINKIS